MIFWILTALITALVASILLGAMWRGGGDGATNDGAPVQYDLQVYRDQLAEVDRDLTRGVINAEDADRIRTEISRRILLADATAETAAHPVKGSQIGATVFGALIVGALLSAAGVYWVLGAPGYGDLALKARIEAADQFRQNRPDQATAEAGLPAVLDTTPQQQNPEYVGLVSQLREVIKERPDDLRGLRLLAISERNLGNFAQAHQVFSRYLDLRGQDASSEEFADLADMLILAAGGYVSPEAEAALAMALQRDPANAPARYYAGLLQAQTGRPDQAFQIWDALLRQGPPDAPWIPPIQAQIDDMAIRAGVNYAQPAPGLGRGPDADAIAAAGDLSSTERLEMIEGMVNGLSERLATEGGTAQEWAQLITSLGVLGRRNDAFAVFQNAQEVFAGDLSALDQIARAGSQAGVAN
ncbi:MAG: c-type cytochrome biogenesis protein CcmI [Paracoccaceae bacterium]